MKTNALKRRPSTRRENFVKCYFIWNFIVQSAYEPSWFYVHGWDCVSSIRYSIEPYRFMHDLRPSKQLHTADFIKKSTFSVHSFNDDYLSIPERPGSLEYLFHEIPGNICWKTYIKNMIFFRPSDQSYKIIIIIILHSEHFFMSK